MKPIPIGLSAVAILAGSTASAAYDVSATKCSSGTVPARIAGKATCLRERQPCRARFDLQYHRHRFHCHRTRLERDDWAPLFRKLRVPSLGPGAPCPAATPDPDGDLSRWGFTGTAWGRGPAYPGTPSAEQHRLVLTFVYPPPPGSLDAESEWSGQKVNWIVASSYDGLFLVRGRQLDGPHVLRFGRGLIPSTALRLKGDRDHPSTVRLRAAGCYAFQVDGFGFRRLVTFEARQIR